MFKTSYCTKKYESSQREKEKKPAGKDFHWLSQELLEH